jgi:hypothetical protein
MGAGNKHETILETLLINLPAIYIKLVSEVILNIIVGQVGYDEVWSYFEDIE